MRILKIVLVIVIGVTWNTHTDDIQASGEPDTIRVISHTHEINFPHEIIFSLEVESDNYQINAIQFFYTLSSGDVKVYGYPSYTTTKRVQTSFQIKTSGAHYIPPGTDLVYYYKITNDNGDTLKTEKFTLEYKDPKYNWTKLRQGNLEILYHDLPHEKVHKILDNVDPQLQAAKKLFGLQEIQLLKAVIVNGRNEAERSFPHLSDKATRGHIFGGFAFDNHNLFISQGLNRNTIAHEITHLLLGQAIYSPMARVPAWLNEGLAMHFEIDSRSRTYRIEKLAHQGRLLKLRAMGAIPGKPNDIDIFYAQSWSLVDFMIRTYGEDRMYNLVAAINRGHKIEDAISYAYGFNIDQLETEWKNYVVPSNDKNSGNKHNTLHVLSGLFIITLIGIAILTWPLPLRLIRIRDS